MKNSIDWKLFFILLSLSMASVICVYPHSLAIHGEKLAAELMDQQFWIRLSGHLLRSLFHFSIAIFFGLFFTRRINFQLPILEAIVGKKDYKKIFERILAESVVYGIAVAAAIYFLDAFFTMYGVTHDYNFTFVWQRLLVSIYMVISGEILMRLFLMTFFIWIGMKLFRHKTPSTAGVIIPIILAAIISTWGFAPIAIAPPAYPPYDNELLVIGRGFVLSGIGGIVFGWLFWKKGFESAVIAHFTTDVFLLTLLPMVFK